MKVCKKCNETSLGDDFFYCSKCGTKLVDSPKCFCGKETGSWEKFCRICGRKVGK